mmetsp:Transcript_15710/g.36510  ORF Transcript_15710/g.36510 Transcript_15710/m.36510 type:complete len:268 (-) Transcript_15710:1061-1864(-)
MLKIAPKGSIESSLSLVGPARPALCPLDGVFDRGHLRVPRFPRGLHVGQAQAAGEEGREDEAHLGGAARLEALQSAPAAEEHGHRPVQPGEESAPPRGGGCPRGLEQGPPPVVGALAMAMLASQPASQLVTQLEAAPHQEHLSQLQQLEEGGETRIGKSAVGQDECGREGTRGQTRPKADERPRQARRRGLEAGPLRSRPSYRGTEFVEPGGGGGGEGWGEGAAQEEVNGRPQRREGNAAQPRHLRLIPSIFRESGVWLPPVQGGLE